MKSEQSIQTNSNGQSVVEIILAVALFTLIAGGGVGTILGSLATTQTTKNRIQATFLAVEGLEAAKSIRNQNYENLVIGTHGLNFTQSGWEFSGSSNPSIDGKFTRALSIEEVNRDENGNIVQNNGSPDEDTKKITSTVSWNVTQSRTEEIELTTYLTNWQKSTGTISATEPETCTEYCQILDYSEGTCRPDPNVCAISNESYESGGDQYCSSEPSSDSCCCQQL